MDTYDEHRNKITTTAAATVNQDDIHKIRLAVQAAVSAELLTSDDDWNIYLQSIQHALNMIKDGIKGLTGQLTDPRVVNQDLFMQIKMALVELEGEQRALEWAISLPKSIKETGKIAKALHDKVPV